MASVVDQCNVALSHVGSDAIVASIDPPDGSVEAGHCARFYPIALAELTEYHAWSFAKKRVQLTQVTNNSTVWAYAYQLPSDCVNPLRVLQALTLADNGYYPFYPTTQYVTADMLATYTERGSADFDNEGGVIYTHEPDAVLIYTAQNNDVTQQSAGFRTAMGYLLASYLAGPLIKGDAGASASAKFRQVVFGRDGHGGLAAQAAATDSNSSSERAGHTPLHLQARG